MNSIDTIVYGTIKNNKFISSLYVSYLTKLPEKIIEDSIKRLENVKKVYQSASGIPKRYSSYEQIIKEEIYYE